MSSSAIGTVVDLVQVSVQASVVVQRSDTFECVRATKIYIDPSLEIVFAMRTDEVAGCCPTSRVCLLEY